MIVAATQRGLTAEDLKDMDIGDIVDFVITYNNMMEGPDQGKTGTVRKATQQDWDRL